MTCLTSHNLPRWGNLILSPDLASKSNWISMLMDLLCGQVEQALGWRHFFKSPGCVASFVPSLSSAVFKGLFYILVPFTFHCGNIWTDCLEEQTCLLFPVGGSCHQEKHEENMKTCTLASEFLAFQNTKAFGSCFPACLPLKDSDISRCLTADFFLCFILW